MLLISICSPSRKIDQLQFAARAQADELTSKRDEIRDLLVAHAQDQVIGANAGL